MPRRRRGRQPMGLARPLATMQLALRSRQPVQRLSRRGPWTRGTTRHHRSAAPRAHLGQMRHRRWMRTTLRRAARHRQKAAVSGRSGARSAVSVWSGDGVTRHATRAPTRARTRWQMGTGSPRLTESRAMQVRVAPMTRSSLSLSRHPLVRRPATPLSLRARTAVMLARSVGANHQMRLPTEATPVSAADLAQVMALNRVRNLLSPGVRTSRKRPRHPSARVTGRPSVLKHRMPYRACTTLWIMGCRHGLRVRAQVTVPMLLGAPSAVQAPAFLPPELKAPSTPAAALLRKSSLPRRRLDKKAPPPMPAARACMLVRAPTATSRHRTTMAAPCLAALTTRHAPRGLAYRRMMLALLSRHKLAVVQSPPRGLKRAT
mmetsp:Transcript_6306/g.22438  ORF Transcript_6306/g.22438 Transcript_6306/m.22438 type:complete len:375 (-) Transcript_6306:2972-4096(-)